MMFESLCSTSTWKALGFIPNTSNFIFSCASELHAKHKGFHKSCVIELLAQYKHQILMCSKASRSRKNISSTMCFRVHSQHTKSYIKHIQFAYNQYIKQIIMFMCTGVLGQIYQLKHQSNIIRNGAYSHKCEVKMRDITSLPT